MKTTDILQETYISLSGNKVRSSLTTLGIVIGISSVIVMIAIGQGAQQSIENSIQSIGSNLIIVYPGAQKSPGVTVSGGRGSAKTLTYDDAMAINENISTVKAVSPEVSSRYQVTAKGKNTNTQIIGVISEYPEIRNIEVSEGSFISEQNQKIASKVAVIGPTVRDDLFGENADAVGQIIRINKIEFKIIGITKSKGGTGFNNPDDMIYIPLQTAQRFLSGNEYLSSISVAATSAETTTETQNQITELLLARHNISNVASADFSTMNQEDIISTASDITGTFTMLLAAIAGISLIVGGIGIMNMMLTTVTERTREIGLRKAIGAKRKDITIQFLTESVALTFIGGAIGVILGWMISFGIDYFEITTTQVSIFSVILAFGVSAAIGIIFGYYPAKRASKLNPIEALRYE